MSEPNNAQMTYIGRLHIRRQVLNDALENHNMPRSVYQEAWFKGYTAALTKVLRELSDLERERVKAKDVKGGS